MSFSILPLASAAVFLVFIFFTRRSRQKLHINAAEALSLYLLLAALAGWTLASVAMGLRGMHTSAALQERIPFLWQACVPVIVIFSALLGFKTLRSAVRGLASGTPLSLLVFFQALRMGAIGGVIKGFNGEILSSYVFWVGIPDFLYGLSALLVGYRAMRKPISDSALMMWSLAGPAIILIPTFAFMGHWMNEPGFGFIFEFPMVLAPSIVVPMLINGNFLLAWKLKMEAGAARGRKEAARL